VGPLKVTQLTLGVLAGNSVMLLDLSKELITFPLDDLPVIVGQPAPLLLGLSDELFPVPFDLVDAPRTSAKLVPLYRHLR
jgi:hypothetical protein